MKIPQPVLPCAATPLGVVKPAFTPTQRQLIRWQFLLVAVVSGLTPEAFGQPSSPLRMTCPPNQTNWHCGVASTAIVTYPTPITIGSCPTNAVVTCAPPSGATFILGTTTVICRATNSCRESATCTFTVTVARDTTPPFIQCPTNHIVWLCGTTVPDARVSWPPPIATDNADPSVAVTCSPPSGSLFPPGTTTVTCTARDDCTNRATCTFAVTVVRDVTPPAITCPGNLSVTACSANGAVVTYATPTATDNADSNVAVTCSPASGSLFPVGATTVTCTATDDCTNRTICTFLVRVTRDTTPPVIPCPSNFVVLACDRLGAIVNYLVPTAADNLDPTPTVTCSPAPGTRFPVGFTTVTCTATDSCTNRSVCTFTVTVRPSLLYGGLCHTPLGLAALNVSANGELEVSGLGASGADGVRIDLGESQGLTFSYRNAPGLTDGDLEVQILGRNAAGQEILASRMMQHYEGGKLSVTPSFASYEVKLLLRGEIVYRRPGTSGRAPVQFCTPVQVEHCPQQVFLQGCWSFVAIECTSETDSGPVLADTMVITPEAPGPQLAVRTAVQIVGQNFPAITLEDERLLMFGSSTQPPLPHRALGQARLVAEDGTLTLADLRSSGQDGVRIDLGKSHGLQWRMKNPPGTPEGDIDIDVFGRTTAGAEVPVRRISHHYRNGRHSVTPGNGPYELQLFRGGQLVFRQGGRTGDVDIPDCQAVEHEHCVGEEFHDLNPALLPYCISFLTIECDWNTDGGPVSADTLVLTPEDPLPPGVAVSAVQLLDHNVRDLPSLMLLTERGLTFVGTELRLACPPDRTVRTCATNPVSGTFPPPVVAGGHCTLPATVVCVPPSGSLFPPGTNTIQCTATNACGERAVCSFTVTVKSDATPRFESEPNDSLAGAQDLGSSQFVVVVGRISPASDMDFYRFTAPPHSLAWITVDTGGPQWTGGNSRDSMVTLLDGAGGMIEMDDNDGSGNGADSLLESSDASAIAGASLAGGGTYYVRVSAIQAGQIIAPYRLYLTVTTNNAPPEIEPNNSFNQANTIVIPASPIGVRTSSLGLNDEDWYAVTLTGPSLLHFSVDGDPERDGIGTDVVVELYRRDGVSRLFSANSSTSGFSVAEGFTYRLSVVGTYYVRVLGAGANVAGTYRIMIAACGGQPELPLAAAARPDGGLVLSWPAASEPARLLGTRDLRTWQEIGIAPTLDGDRLIALLPIEPPHQFFLLSPSGGNANDTYHCCDPDGQNCHQFHPGLGDCLGLVLRCYETENSSVCEPSDPHVVAP